MVTKVKKLQKKQKAFIRLRKQKALKRKKIYKRVAASVNKRHATEKRFKIYAKTAIAISIVFLAVLLANIFINGLPAFLQTKVSVEVLFSEDMDSFGLRDIQELEKADYRKVLQEALKTRFPEVTTRKDKFALYNLVSKEGAPILKKMVLENPKLVGTKKKIWLPASSIVDMYIKGKISETIPESKRKLKDKQIRWIKELQENNQVELFFNRSFFTAGDSREPEAAGILGSMLGSLLVILSCIALAFPLGVLTAIYLEEFAPKNKLTDLIEVNINNLAAVPSIVFGLLGLAIYIQFFGIPRSAALAGGLTLALMALPIIVISTRTSIRAIPQSIRDGAIALGASKIQTTFDHVIPLAMPGIMTGTILSIARVLGETAPLLMIGMVAFIVDIPKGFLDPSTALPVQVYLWADSPELGFIEKTSAAIIILLALLIVINAVAVVLRKKFETRW